MLVKIKDSYVATNNIYCIHPCEEIYFGEWVDGVRVRYTHGQHVFIENVTVDEVYQGIKQYEVFFNVN